MGPSSSAVLVVAGYLVFLVMVVPPAKSSPFGFGLLCDPDYYEETLCALFGSCEESEESDDSEESEEIATTAGPVTSITSTTMTPSTSAPSTMASSTNFPNTMVASTITPGVASPMTTPTLNMTTTPNI